MSKAEDLALEKYPQRSVLVVPASGGGYYADSHLREGFIEGYQQAEKDLIDKAIVWIGEIYNYHEIMRYSDSCEPPLSELTKWFKNYVKEGGKDE